MFPNAIISSLNVNTFEMCEMKVDVYNAAIVPLIRTLYTARYMYNNGKFHGIIRHTCDHDAPRPSRVARSAEITPSISVEFMRVR